LSCVSSFHLLLFFLAYSQPSHIRCLPYIHTWCGLNANLGCRPEACCVRLAKNTRRKKRQKIRHLCTIAQFCSAISSQLKYTSTIGKRLVKQQYLLHMSSQYGELRLLAAEICWRVWCTPANFNGFRVLVSLLQRCRSMEVNQTLHDV